MTWISHAATPSASRATLGPIPDLDNEEILKDLARCFTSKDNPAGTSRPNVQFQRDLTTMIRADSAYYSNPTLGRLCQMVASIMHRWERLTAETNRMGGHVTSEYTVTANKSKKDAATPTASTGTETSCNARAATDRATQGPLADFKPIRTSTKRDLGLVAPRRNQSAPGIRAQWFNFHGRSELMAPRGRDCQ